MERETIATNTPAKPPKERCLAASGMLHYIKNKLPSQETALTQWQGRVYAAIQSECRFNSVIDWSALLEELNRVCEDQELIKF